MKLNLCKGKHIGFSIKLLIVFFISFTLVQCKKEKLNETEFSSKVLSKNSVDLQERPKNIKQQYYKLNLQKDFIGKVKQDVTWSPDWEKSTIQVINDTVSYVFFPMNGYYSKGNIKGLAKTRGAKFYLIVKNEKEFYKGVYFNAEKDDSTNVKKEVVVGHFTGKLILNNLQTKQSFLIKYNDGKVLDNLTKDQKLASAKSMSLRGTSSYWETQCHQEMKYCVYTSDGYSYCGGAVDIVVSYNCVWPSPQCGVSYYMIDYSEETVCEDIWFPDPPIDPGDNGGTGGGGGDDGVTDDVPNGEMSESDYLYTCPDNFSFSVVTTNDLWQEGVLTNIYCNLGILDFMTQTISNAKTVQIPAVSFGIPYKNIEGTLLYTQNQAKAIAADALNEAEKDMRKKYKANPYLTSGQLADYWVARINIRLKEYTGNRGRAGRTGSQSPSQPIPSRPYNPC